MTLAASVVLPIVVLLVLACLYIIRNDRRLKTLPEAIEKVNPQRWSPEDIKRAFKRAKESPVDVLNALPPRTGRRYIVVGGVRMPYYSLGARK